MLCLASASVWIFAASLVVTVGAPSDSSEKQAFAPDAIPRVRGQHFMLLWARLLGFRRTGLGDGEDQQGSVVVPAAPAEIARRLQDFALEFVGG
jgi:hypothetical protein